MSAYTEFYLNSKSNIVQYELLEISHPSFSQTYRIVRNAVAGVTALIDGVSRAFTYYPLRISRTGQRDNLDYSYRIDLGDLGTIIPQELDGVAFDDGFDTKPTVRYWIFRSDNLNTPLLGPLILEIQNLTSNKEGSSFEAKAPSVSINRTGELYRLNRFPMLRGSL